jgi:hypothetical protein
MTDFVFPEVIETEAWESAALGTCRVSSTNLTSTTWLTADAGRALTLNLTAGTQGYTECAATNEIDAFLMTVEPAPVNNGAAFGAIKREGVVRAKAGGAIAYGAYVVAGTAPDRGTTETLAVVNSGSPTKCLWRYIRLIKTAAGVRATTAAAAGVAAAAGDEILLERI